MIGQVKIRTDGSSEIGLGHVVRCMALAYMLKQDFDLQFYSRKLPATIHESLLKKGFSVQIIESENDFLESLSKEEIVVLDHYGLGSEYQIKVKQIGCRLICIDDLRKNEFYADLIINSAPGVDSNDYAAQSYTNFALGPGYSLLRPSFLEATKIKKPTKEIETVLICFGGSDFKNITDKVLSVLGMYSDFKRISIVVGSAYQHEKNLRITAKEFQNVQVLSALTEEEMVELIVSTDVAIVPTSSILLEVIAAGTIPIITYYAENQRFLFEHFSRLIGIESFSSYQFDAHQLQKVVDKQLTSTGNNSELEIMRAVIGESKNNILFKIKSLFNG